MFVRLSVGSQRLSATRRDRAIFGSLSDTSVAMEPERAETADRRTSARPAAPALPPPPPRIKTYRSTDMRQAMATARQELGEDAILIQTKRLDPGQADDARYEVTFGIGGPVLPAPAPAPAKPREAAPRVSEASPAEPGLAQEFARLREEIAGLRAMVAGTQWNPTPAGSPLGPIAPLRNLLLRHGVEADVASDWSMQLLGSDGPELEHFTASMLAEHLRTRIRLDASLGWDDTHRKAAMFLGPPASGKTTVVIKLALEYGIKRGRPVEILSLDRIKPGLDHAIESVAGMLNVPCRSFKSAQALAAALAGPRPDNCLTLIDSSGFGMESVDLDQELARMLEAGAPIVAHLVVSAAWHSAGIRRAVDRFEVFQPSRILFTMLDQAGALGPVLGEPWRTGKALSFFNNAPLGSGLIQPANVAFVLDAMDRTLEA